ncbi:hypothetical protein HY988_01755 [Candidatus Micrarchaeota archaeon]|nr:hypothetical protein [Candidatus Micrarchaeota archaeon]
MTTHRRSNPFGEALERRGDYPRAIAAFRSAGLEEAVHRVEAKVHAIELSRRLEENWLYARAAKALLAHDLHSEALALSDKIAPQNTPRSEFARGLIAINTNKIDLLQSIIDNLASFGPNGVYLSASLAAQVNPNIARSIADGLSGKPSVAPSKSPIAGAATPTTHKLFFDGSDPTSSRSISSGIAWSLTSRSELLYYALRIYHQLGDNEEVSRSLDLLQKESSRRPENMKYFLGALISIGQIEAAVIDVPEGFATLGVLLSRRYAQGGVAAIIQLIGFWYGEGKEKEQVTAYDEIIYDLPISEFITNEDLFQLIEKRTATLSALRSIQQSKIAALDQAIAIVQSYADIERAQATMEGIDFNVLVGDRRSSFSVRHTYSLRLATLAAQFTDDPKAQAFAGSIFSRSHQQGPKAVECAQRLLAMGQIIEAKGILLSDSLHEELGSDAILKLAHDLETNYPVVSLELYLKCKSKPDFVRMVHTILERNIFEEIDSLACKVSLAWQLSPNIKQSFLMRNCLAKLEGFGPEGAEKARAIRTEMSIGNLFVETDIDTNA